MCALLNHMEETMHGYLITDKSGDTKMKLLITAAIVMVASGTAFADQRDHLNLSFQDHEHFTSQPAVGSADVDYVHLSFQDKAYEITGSQPEIGGVEFDYINESFQESY